MPCRQLRYAINRRKTLERKSYWLARGKPADFNCQREPFFLSFLSLSFFFFPTTRRDDYDSATGLLTGRMSNRYAKLCHCNRITWSPFSQPSKSKAVLDERNINERNPKTNWIDRLHVIRRGEDATRQLPSGFFPAGEHVRNISSGDFDIEDLPQNSIRVGCLFSRFRVIPLFHSLCAYTQGVRLKTSTLQQTSWRILTFFVLAQLLSCE